MSFLKTPTGLFLEEAELQRLIRFLDQDGFRFFLLQQSSRFGVIRHIANDPSFANFRIQSGTNAGKVQIARNSYAIDSKGRVLYQRAIDNLAIPTANQWYWMRISYVNTPIEVGSVSVDRLGNVTGVNTKFTEILRGGPNFPSRIAFTNSTLNTNSYEVRQVLSDTSLVVVGNAFQAEVDLQYKSIGTFTPGNVPTAVQKDVFQYDSCKIDFIPESYDNAMPAFAVGQEFLLARVRINGSIIEIQDKRVDFWQTTDTFRASLISGYPSPLIGVESIRWDNPYSTQQNNIVDLAWSFRTDNWTVDSNLNRLSIAGGKGGRYKTPTQFISGNFTGWHVYLASGKRHLVTDSVLIGSQINLTLDTLNPLDFKNLGETIIIAPAVEEVEIRFTGGGTLTEQRFLFPVNLGVARFPVLVPSDSAINYIVEYRYKLNQQYSAWLTIPEDPIGYYQEVSFDAYGNLDSNTRNHRRQATLGGYVSLTPSQNSFRSFANKVDTGDLFGVTVRKPDNTNPVINLKVGTDRQHQIIKIEPTSSFTLTTDHVINLTSLGAKNGNSFFIDFVGAINNVGFGMSINSGYQTTGNRGVVLKTLTRTEFDYIRIPERKVSCKAIYDGSTWHLTVLESDMMFLGQIIQTSRLEATDFDSTGNGISIEYLGKALCNGQNGTANLQDRFIVGMNTQQVLTGVTVAPSDYYAIGNQGGAGKVSLIIAEMPNHDHGFANATTDNQGSTGAGDTYAKSFGGSGGLDQGRKTLAVGGSPGALPGEAQPHENRPPYYTLAFLQRIPYVPA